MENAGALPSQHRAILGQAGSEYVWDQVVEAMLILLDGGDVRRPNIAHPGGKQSAWSYPVAEDWSGCDVSQGSTTEDAKAVEDWYDDIVEDEEIPASI